MAFCKIITIKIFGIHINVLVQLTKSDDDKEFYVQISTWEIYNAEPYYHWERIEVVSYEQGIAVVRDFSVESAKEFAHRYFTEPEEEAEEIV